MISKTIKTNRTKTTIAIMDIKMRVKIMGHPQSKDMELHKDITKTMAVSTKEPKVIRRNTVVKATRIINTNHLKPLEIRVTKAISKIATTTLGRAPSNTIIVNQDKVRNIMDTISKINIRDTRIGQARVHNSIAIKTTLVRVRSNMFTKTRQACHLIQTSINLGCLLLGYHLQACHLLKISTNQVCLRRQLNTNQECLHRQLNTNQECLHRQLNTNQECLLQLMSINLGCHLLQHSKINKLEYHYHQILTNQDKYLKIIKIYNQNRHR